MRKLDPRAGNTRRSHGLQAKPSLRTQQPVFREIRDTANPASAGVPEKEPLPAARGRDSRSDLLAPVPGSVASRSGRDWLGVGLECWSREVKRSVLPRGKEHWPSRAEGRCGVSPGQINSRYRACWWQVRRFGGRGRGTACSRPLGGSSSGTPTEACAQSCDRDRSEHNEQRRVARHDTPPFGLAVSPQTRRYARVGPLSA